MRVVFDYPDVFFEKLPALPPVSDVNCKIKMFWELLRWLELRLWYVLGVLKREQLYAELSKWEFWLRETYFLGHIICKNDAQVDPAKVEAVMN